MHVMNYLKNNKNTVYKMLSKTFKEFHRPDVIQISDVKEKTRKTEKQKSCLDLPFPYNIFGDVKIQEKIDYVDLFAKTDLEAHEAKA